MNRLEKEKKEEEEEEREREREVERIQRYQVLSRKVWSELAYRVAALRQDVRTCGSIPRVGSD